MATDPDRSEQGEIQSESPTVSKEQRWSIHQQFDIRKGHGPDVLDLTSTELRKIQDEDPTLTKVKEAAVCQPSITGVGFFRRVGIIYRRWISPGWGEEAVTEQLVLPKQCRRTVLELAHDIHIAGHLGKRKKLDSESYVDSIGPVYSETSNSFAGVVTCQKATHRGVRQAPLIPMPVISVPFSRIAMDIVRPLPKSRLGNRYILVLFDYATRYPEAIALRSVDAEHIAEQLIGVFTRVGLPQEILMDQESKFTSQLLAELYRLLHVQSIRTSPYHPQTDGLVERFNQTLKSMLRI